MNPPTGELQDARLGHPSHETFQAPYPAVTATATAVEHPPPQSHTAPGQAHTPLPAQAQGRMRSSIACVRCRRSKVKCVNNGVTTTCRSCENAGRECSYPPPVASGSRRCESLSGRPDAQGDVERRQRPRKSATFLAGNTTSHSQDSPRPLLDALDGRILTPIVWQELFDIFQVHYSADLPFLHPPTFLKPLRQAAFQQTSNDGAPQAVIRPPASTEFLLAFLALTARFHPKLVAHHSPSTSTRASRPLIASEYYAAAAYERISAFWVGTRCYNDIELCQATLMLGLHEWGMCRGAKAWLNVGIAIRSAQAMGLQYESDLDDEPMSRSLALNGEAERMGMTPNRFHSGAHKSGEDAFIQQEIRRRTFWSCYIMDRYLSSGKYRPQMLHARELRIQLPASERSFLFAEKVRTLMLGEEDKHDASLGRAEVQSQRQQSVMLGTANCTPEPNVPSPTSMALENDDEKGRLEVGPDEGLVSRYVKVLEIYGKVIKWSCSGGRRTEEFPPWDPRCEFYRLRRQCQDFKASLPRQNALTPQNTQAHISLKTSTPYTLVHTVYLLCQIMLHREYVPFIPIRCSKPEGPVDPPLFPPDKYTVPPGFWEGNARECFKSAREIMDLVRTCQEWNALVETPIVGFAIYTVAFNGVYCINFPWMDPDGYMCTASSSPSSSTQPNNSQPGESKGFEAARKALEMIGSMRPKLHMADGWFKTINKMHKYFRRLKSDYRKASQAIESSSEGDSPISTRNLSLREGGSGGGLNEFRLLERTLQEFGNLEDENIEMADMQQNDSKLLDGVYDDSSPESEVKSEGGQGERPTTDSEPRKTSEGGSWSAINASQQPSLPTPVSQFRSYEAYPSQHQHQQQPATQQPSQHPSQRPTQHPTPPQGPSSQHHGYNHPSNNFRPTYPDTAAGATPSLTSPTSHSATKTTPSQSQPSPPYDHQQNYFQHHHHQQQQPASYQGWQPTNSSYAMQPPLPNPYINGPHHQHHNPPQLHPNPNPMQPTPLHSTYSSPGHAAVPPPLQPNAVGGEPPPPHPPQHQQQQQQPQNWAPANSKEAWLNSIDTRLGGDDVAAFVDGGEMHEWASMAAGQGFGGGWLSTVWGGRTS